MIILEDSSSESAGSGSSNLILEEVGDLGIDGSPMGQQVEEDRGVQGWHMRVPVFDVDEELHDVQSSFAAEAEDVHLLNIPSDDVEVVGHSNFEEPCASGIPFDHMAHFLYGVDYNRDMELDLQQLEHSLGLDEAQNPSNGPIQLDSPDASFGSYPDSYDRSESTRLNSSHSGESRMPSSA